MSNFLTQNGLNELIEELKIINEEKMPKILEGLNEALAAGDLSENSARDGLLIEQKNLLDRKQYIEDVLKNYTIIEENNLSQSKTVKIGSTVKLEYTDSKKIVTVQILGSSEADILEGKVSNEAPVILQILGKKAGTEVNFKHKNTKQTVKILEIL
jgi:transcription elongation factor GreA